MPAIQFHTGDVQVFPSIDEAMKFAELVLAKMARYCLYEEAALVEEHDPDALANADFDGETYYGPVDLGYPDAIAAVGADGNVVWTQL